MPDTPQTQQPGDNDAMLRLIADTTPAMLAYFEAGTLLCRFANARYAEYFGKQPQEILGLSVREIVGEHIWKQISPYLQRLEEGALETIRYTRQAQDHEGRKQHMEAALHPHVIEGVLIGVVALITDVSHHHSLTQQVLASEERMRKFAAITTEAIVLHRDGLILDGNDALVRMTGYSIDELRGSPILDYVVPQFRLKALQYMRSEREDSHQSAFIRKNGELMPVEAEAKTMPGEGNEYRIVLLRDITANIQARQHLDYLAQHDLLTSLPNRSHLSLLLEESLTLARSQQTRVAVLSLDLDQFKAVNDSLSHRAGDLLLCEVAQRLRNALRPQDEVARIGGDEFVVLLAENPSLLETEALATQLRAVAEQPYQIDGTQLVISLSMGIAMFPKDGNSPEELISNAEAAMHMAKSRGRSFVQFYTSALEGRATRMLMQEQLLRQAVERGEFELHYQPQLYLDSGELAGFEALVRWKHPHRGLVLPDEFIGFAENRGLIAAIDHWVLREACRQTRAWQDAGYPAVPVAVNLSAQEFRQRDVVQEVSQALTRAGLDARLLHIELTESTLMQSGGQMPDALHALKALGVGLAIDDFGTGYSSLAYLRKHPIDRLKIDRSFICDLPHNPDAAAIVGAIVQMGRSLHLRIIAEGVETLAQRELLQSMGCDMMQGFLVSAPLSSEQAQHWMSQHCHPLQRQ
ncbi:MAG: EAL domain-containing protein [Comamonas sp.]|jgi:diguanylate cyclase (GGDEF)-like protein/PAS domain S-box-containing protein|uniref:putative bifunctional diguanylate cyclase/phosphodiesterase n=1 Tax=Comamonas sp. TaxID=34028 RepID=UPI002839AD86|nr:EAL domain-containing protein [Comamonas sp.]MDR0214360.1 EAL domain-containing protein [Comamonas sp.]MDR2298155.1 EAL domain-containing protein [Comamonas sp.]